MRPELVRPAIALVAIALALTACGPRETPEQRVQRLREYHEIIPLGSTTIRDADDVPSVIVDLQVTNHGGEHLPQLTVMVRIRSTDGVEVAAERVSLDLHDVRPGVGAQRDVRIQGVALGENDEVTVELELGLAPEVIRQLPEFSAAGVD